MKKLGVLLLSIFVWCTVSCSKKEVESFSNEALKAKAFDVNGSEIQFSEIVNNLKGKPTIIKIWAGWCSDCITSMPEWNNFANEHPEFNFLAFSVDHKDSTWKNAVAKYKVSGEHYRLNGTRKWKSSDFAKSINLGWIPRYIVLDENGNIASKEHIIKISDPKVLESLGL